MKNVTLCCISFIIILILIGQTACVNSSDQKQIAAKIMTASDAHLGEHMGLMQYYMVKLGLSLQNKNQPLANFYIHEIDETYEELASMNIVDDSIPVSQLLNDLLDPKIKDAVSIIE